MSIFFFGLWKILTIFSNKLSAHFSYLLFSETPIVSMLVHFIVTCKLFSVHFFSFCSSDLIISSDLSSISLIFFSWLKSLFLNLEVNFSIQLLYSIASECLFLFFIVSVFLLIFSICSCIVCVSKLFICFLLSHWTFLRWLSLVLHQIVHVSVSLGYVTGD